MNFGHKIVIFIFIFVSFILCIVYVATHQQFDLVTEKYYEKELDFNNLQKKATAANALQDSVYWEVKDQLLWITLPIPNDSTISGHLYLFRPSDGQQDVSLNLVNKITVLPVKGLQKGYYKILADWQVGSQHFYAESKIMIP